MSTSPIVGSMIKDVEWPNGSIIGSIKKTVKYLGLKAAQKLKKEILL
jgi:hypothetical protein